MKIGSYHIITASTQTQPARKPRKTMSLAHRQRYLYGRPRHYNTGKEIDPETGLYYFGARYLDPKTSRWISGDPAVGEYLPSAPVNDEARKRNGNLPGMGGVFNYVNLHVYHYAGNNPVKYTDPDGRVDQSYLRKGRNRMLLGRLQIEYGAMLVQIGWASIFTNPAAPAMIDRGMYEISEGQKKVREGISIINRAWIADSIGKGHAYTKHVQGLVDGRRVRSNEFSEFGITGDGSLEDQERFVSLINDVLENPTAHKPNRNSGNEMYLDKDRDIIIYLDPRSKDKGTIFRPPFDPDNPQSAEDFFYSN